MQRPKRKRILENLYDIIAGTDFKEVALKELEKDIGDSNIVCDYDNRKITIDNKITITIK